MSFKRFHAQVYIELKILMETGIDIDSCISDDEYIREKIQEKVHLKLDEELPKLWLDDVEIEIVAIK